MTTESILNFSIDHINDLVRVYNSGRNRCPNFVPLSPQDIKELIQVSVISTELIFLALGGPRPIAVARWGRNDINGWAFITDLCCVPGLWPPVEKLIEHILVLARDASIESVRTWVPSCYLKLAELLTEFTFEPRRVRLQMQTSLGTVFEESGKKPKKALRWKAEIKGNSHALGHQLLRPLELYEARDNFELKWKPRYYVRGKNGQPAIAGYQSSTERTRGWISLNEDITERTMPSVTSEMVAEVVRSLYSDGVREIACEIDATKEMQTPFTVEGFEVVLTLYEMELTMAY